MTSEPTVLVLCGGTARRFGSDKLAAHYAGTTVLDHLLDTLPATWPVVCVGPPRPTRRAVTWTREEPPGGGPLAGVAAGLTGVGTAHVLVVAGDMPAAAAALPLLLAALADGPGVDAVVATDATGRPNPLLAAYRTDALRTTLPPDPAGRPARTLLAMSHRELPVDPAQAWDVDTPEDLAPPGP